VGKPANFIFELAQLAYHLDPCHCLMVGDSLDMDIAFARKCGMDSALVLSVVTIEAEARKSQISTYILPNATALVQ